MAKINLQLFFLFFYSSIIACKEPEERISSDSIELMKTYLREGSLLATFALEGIESLPLAIQESLNGGWLCQGVVEAGHRYCLCYHHQGVQIPYKIFNEYGVLLDSGDATTPHIFS